MKTKVPIPPGWESDLDPDARIEMLIECLSEEKYVPLAEMTLPYLGRAFVDILVKATCDMAKTPNHRARLIHLIDKLGFGLDLDQIWKLVRHRACKCPTVTAAIEDLVVVVKYGGLPPIPCRGGTFVEMAKHGGSKRSRKNPKRKGSKNCPISLFNEYVEVMT